jgi:hypothetical protein
MKLNSRVIAHLELSAATYHVVLMSVKKMKYPLQKFHLTIKRTRVED